MVGFANVLDLLLDDFDELVVIVVPKCEELLEVVALVIVLDVNVLQFEQRLSDLLDVVGQHLLFDDDVELGIVIHQFSPVLFADRVASAFTVSSVDEDLPPVEAHFEGTNHSADSKANPELLHFVYLIANVVLSLLNEQDFIHFIQLAIDRLSRTEMPRLQQLQHFDDEVLVGEIVPIVIGMLDPHDLVLIR